MNNIQKLRILRTFQSKLNFPCLSKLCYSSSNEYNQNRTHNEFPKYRVSKFATTASVIGVGSALLLCAQHNYTADADSSLQEVAEGTEEFGCHISGLPEYSLSDVSKHNSIETRVWISFRHGVYDITDFIDQHPGGDKIMLGAGGSVEPFWALYAVHKNSHVLQILEKYRIGNLTSEDVGSMIKDMDDPYANEPRRHIALKPSSNQPFNAEPPVSLLVESLLTPNELFFVRNHLPVPELDSKTYELEIEGLEVKKTTLTLQDIKNFPKCTITAALQCGGNRRSEMIKVKPVKGLNWGEAAISNATWSGARLYDVLKAAGVSETDTKAIHVQFEGYDLDPTGNPFGASIPIEKAMDPKGDVLLAYEMNGQPLPRDHGYPIRVVVPGVVGARNVKWLARIIVSEEESDSHWQQNDYKGFAPNIDWNNVDFTKSPAIQEMPVTSAICVPNEGEIVKLKEGKIMISGYAYSGGGRKIIRVDVSANGGKNWQAADVLESDKSKHPRSWGWTIWKAEIPVSKGEENNIQLVAKAVDSNYNTQPDKVKDIWNLRGVLSNAYHRVNVKIEK